jgi:hypothetical protein
MTGKNGEPLIEVLATIKKTAMSPERDDASSRHPALSI